MGLWPCLPALLVVWTCALSASSHPSVPGRLQSAAAAALAAGHDHARLRRSRSSQSGVGRDRVVRPITVPPPFDTVNKFDSVMIHCAFSGSPAPSVDWLKDGHLLRKAGLAENLEEQTNSLDALLSEPSETRAATHARLYLDCMTPREQGIYTCQGQTAFSVDSASTELLVDDPASVEGMALCERVKDMRVAPARIVQWRSQMLAMMGKRARLVCETTGFPAPQVTWHKDDRLVTYDDPRLTLMPNGDLIFDTLKWSDMGLYRCTATNEFATDTVTSFLYPFKPSN
ncbi:zwei Ig domain protein zig-2-like [Pollicipes pollicipes]|uniref:zwei Ig domain protein zig-2-like n=1 Tax=Pollicipes pollicipes TaxID=41117 RepID=UPI0018850AD3|nr:zwei Ig domain protein zig-2-like [Pollicipes pollicipes]